MKSKIFFICFLFILIISGAIDSSVPGVSLGSPSGGYMDLNQTFIGNFSVDTNLANATLYIWNLTDSVINTTTAIISGLTNTTYTNVTVPRNDTYKWNYYACDDSSNCSFAVGNQTLFVGVLSYNLLYNNISATSNTGNIYNGINFLVNVTNSGSALYIHYTFNISTNSSYAVGKINGTDGFGSSLANGSSLVLNITINGTKKEKVSFQIFGYPTIEAPYLSNSSTQLNVTANISDNIAPIVHITSPLNNSFSNSLGNSFVCDINEFGDGYVNVSAFLYNLSGSVKSSHLNGEIFSSNNYILQNVTRVLTAPTVGNFTWGCLAIDSSGNRNYDTEGNYTIIIDQTYPTIAYSTGNQNDGTNTTLNYITVNLSISETYFQNVSYVLFNSTAIVNTTTYNTLVQTINWTSLAQATYYYNATTCDKANNCNTTSTRTLTIDSSTPLIELNTPVNGSYVNSATNFSIVASDNLGIKNYSVNIYNSSGQLYNRTTIGLGQGITSIVSGIVVGLINDAFTWYYDIYDWSGNNNLTINRTVIFDNVFPLLTFNTPTNNQVLTIPVITINYTVSDTYFNITNITIYDTNNQIVNTTTNTTAGQIVFTKGVPSEGNYSIIIRSYDAMNNMNQSSRNITVDINAPIINATSPINEKVYYVNQKIPIHFTVSDAKTSSKWFNNGTNTTFNNVVINQSYEASGRYNITFYANDSQNRLSSYQVIFNVTTLPSNTTIMNLSSLDVNQDTKEIVLDYNNGPSRINVPSNNSAQEVNVNLDQFNNNGTLTIINSLNLSRESTTNYTINIPADTRIISDQSWDGRFRIPIASTGSFNNPSEDGNTSTIDQVIEIGSTSGINFSNAVKITFSGKSGQKAAWSSGTSDLTPITINCDSLSAPSNIDATTNRECYNDSGSDLIIWTYHLSEYATYTSIITPATDTNNGGRSGGGSSSGAVTGSTFILTEAQLISGTAKNLTSKDKVKFLVNKLTHILSITSISSSGVAITINSTPQNAFLTIGEEKKFDLDSDNYYDLLVKVVGINTLTNTSQLYLKGINEMIVTTKPVETKPADSVIDKKAENKPNAENVLQQTAPAKKPFSFGKIILLMIVIIMIGIVIFFIISSRKKDRPNINHKEKVDTEDIKQEELETKSVKRKSKKSHRLKFF